MRSCFLSREKLLTAVRSEGRNGRTILEESFSTGFCSRVNHWKGFWPVSEAVDDGEEVIVAG